MDVQLGDKVRLLNDEPPFGPNPLRAGEVATVVGTTLLLAREGETTFRSVLPDKVEIVEDEESDYYSDPMNALDYAIFKAFCRMTALGAIVECGLTGDNSEALAECFPDAMVAIQDVRDKFSAASAAKRASRASAATTRPVMQAAE